MRDYLLGNLDPKEQFALQDRIACDPRLYEELLEAEKELIDDYVAGRLSKHERHQFETHFHTTAERQKDLRFGQLVKERLNSDASLPHKEETNQIKKTAPSRKFSFLFGRRRKNFMKRLH